MHTTLAFESLTHPCNASFLLLQLNWKVRRDASTAVPVVETPGHYEYEPTALLRPDGNVDVWTCSGAVPPHNFDAIVHTRLTVNSSSGVVPRHQRPVPALVPTHNASHIDGWGVCAPSVLAVPDSTELRMYYECASFLTDKTTGNVFTGFCQVCLARSVTGGEQWEKWGGDSRGWVAVDQPAEPVVVVSDWMLNRCQFEFVDGRFLVDRHNCSFYGTGHPSAIADVTSVQPWQLFYYNHSGSWAEHGVYFASSKDGIHFGPGVQTTLTNPVEIRRVDNSGNLAGFPAYLATMSLSSPADDMRWRGRSIAYYGTSDDAVTWRWPLEHGDHDDSFAIGLANQTDCACPGQGSFVANASGFASASLVVGRKSNGDKLRVAMFVGNGRMGRFDGGKQLGCYAAQEDVSRGSTWATYLMHGSFSLHH